MNILHITNAEFPIDIGFRGNEVLTNYYIDNSQFSNKVLDKKKRFTNLNKGLYQGHEQILDNHKYDALIFHDFNKKYFKELLINNYNKPTYFFIHCLRELYPLSEKRISHENNKEILHKLITKKNFHLLSISEAAKKSFKEIYPDVNITVIGGAADPILYNPNNKKSNPVNADFVIGYAGRPDNIKGTKTLLEIIKRFNNNKNMDVGFYLALSGPKEKRADFIESLYAEVPELVNNDKIKICVDLSKIKLGKYENKIQKELYIKMIGQEVFDNNIFTGFIHHPLQNSIDLYLHPSNSEAYGLSILEALMAGVPVVASDVGGIKELVNKNNGQLVHISEYTRESYKQTTSTVDSNDVNNFYNAIITELRNSKNPQTITDTVIDYTPKNFSRKLDTIISGNA